MSGSVVRQGSTGQPGRSYSTHDDLVLLAQYLLATDHSAADIVYAIEKPWKYGSEIDDLEELILTRGQPVELAFAHLAKQNWP